jgi:thioredoxin 1
MSTILWGALGGLVLALVAMAAFQALAGAAARGHVGHGLPALRDEVPAQGAALVFFHSPTCGPCKAQIPALVAMGARGHKVVTIDVTERGDVAQAFRIMATPTTVAVRDGTIVEVLTGVVPLAKLIDLVSAPIVPQAAEAVE